MPNLNKTLDKSRKRWKDQYMVDNLLNLSNYGVRVNRIAKF